MKLFSKVKSIFEKQLEKLNKFSSNYLISNYPVKLIFDVSKDNYKYWKITDNLSLFSHIIEKKDEIEDLEKDIRNYFTIFNLK